MHDDIKKALNVIREGGLILYPTDTIWGIGCDATNIHAVDRIYQLKQRSDSKALLVLLDGEFRLTQYVQEVPEVAWELIEANDKPMTIIYPGAKNLANNLIAPDGSIGIRVTADPFCQKLISQFKKPLVSTSANVSGEESPSCFDEVSDIIRQGVDYIVGYRQDDTRKATPSSVIRLGTGGQIEILRK